RRVKDLGEVCNGGPRVGVRVHVVPQRVAPDPRHPAVRITDVADDDCARGAGLGPDRGEAAVTERAGLGQCRVLGAADPLHTEGALFHDAAGPHRHVGVELQVQRLGPGPLVVLVPVEVPHLVGAVVAAVTGTHAAVVHLAVEAVRSVIGGVY